MRRHRFFLVPTRPDLAVTAAIDHWEQRHGAVFAATPHLGGYVQHQPTRADQDRLGGRVCAEAWFEDRDAEARAFGSDHYRGPVTQDEDRFVDRSRAWAALVVAEELTGPAAPAEDAAVEGAPVESDPVEGAPVEGDPVEGDPVEGAPVEGAAVEVVAVGCDATTLPADVAARVLTMDRPGPAQGHATVVVAAVADEAAGRRLVGQLTADVAFVARRNPVKPPRS